MLTKRPAGRVLIIIDKRGWSYDTIARGLVRFNDNESLILDIAAADEDSAFIARAHKQYDLVFPLGWTDVLSKDKDCPFRARLPFIPADRLITGIHSHRAWDGYRSTPDHSPVPPPELILKLGELRGINTVSRRLYNIFQHAGLSNLTLTENGVDTDLFNISRPVVADPRMPLVLGFCGSKEIAKHDRLKGYSEFVAPLNDLPNVRVKVLGARGEHQVAREDMPALYNQIDLYVCASASEGFSQSVLEAAACGRGILSTRVGGSEDLIIPGHNGFLVPRNLDQFKALVGRLERDRPLVATLGLNSRRVVEREFAWRVKVTDWLRFIESHLSVSD